MNRKPLIAVTALALTSMGTFAQAQSDYGINLGAQVGVYMPTNGAIRDAFGSSVLNFGLGPVGDPRRPGSGSVTPGLEFLTANKNGNRLFIGTFTYGYEKHFGDENAKTVPYARVFAGGAYFDYGITEISGRKSAKRFGATGGAEVGVVLASRLKLSAKYNLFSKQDGFDFNGLTLSATFSVFKL